jgi:hypothetical protein
MMVMLVAVWQSLMCGTFSAETGRNSTRIDAFYVSAQRPAGQGEGTTTQETPKEGR